MASTQDLKRRVRSITNTRKLTRAMELVASARLRRAQQRIEAMRPYADRMLELMAGVSQAAGAVRLPLLERRETIERVAIVPVTGDRGLAGAFNAQVLRRAFALMREVEADGPEGRVLPLREEGGLDASLPPARGRPGVVGLQRPARVPATRRRWRTRVSEAYTNGEVDRVVIVYNAFVSPLVQKVTVRDVLPIPQDLLERSADDEAEEDAIGGTPDFIYEPEPEEILARLLPVYVETELYRALLESAASEQGARMTAMRNASKAAGELIDSLTLAMNRARQAEITQEILEVVAGADALSG